MATNVEEVVDIAHRPEPQPEHHSPARRSLSRKLIWLLILTVLAIVGYWLFGKWQTRQTAAAKPPQAGPPAVPVVVATVQKGEMPVYLNGLGSVDPLNT